MARYNSVNSTNSVGAGSTISSPFSGLLTTIPSAGTVTIPNPVLYAGTTQTFYNAGGSGNVILTTPSGVFNGPGAGGTSNFTLPFGSIVTLVSDGTNYITQAWVGGPISTTTLSASSTVTLSPANTTVTISPSGSGTVIINPATASSMDNVNVGATTQGTGKFSSLIATGTLSTTATTVATLGTGGTGALQVAGGASVAGILNVGGATYHAGNVSVGTSSTSHRLTVQGDTNAVAAQVLPQGALPDNNDNAGLYVLHQGTAGTGLRVRTDNALTGTIFAHVLINNAGAGINGFQVSQFGTGFIADFNKGGVAANSVRIDNSGNMGIGTTSPGATLDMGSRTDAVSLPKGTTAQRPTGATGYFRFNTTFSTPEFFTGSAWSAIGLKDGSSFASAATSAVALYDLGIRGKGLFWITKADGTPIQVYCDLDTISPSDGKAGWMLVGSWATASEWTKDSTSSAATFGATALNCFSSSFGNTSMQHMRVKVSTAVDTAVTSSEADWYYYWNAAIQWKTVWAAGSGTNTHYNSNTGTNNGGVGSIPRNSLRQFTSAYNLRWSYASTQQIWNNLSDSGVSGTTGTEAWYDWYSGLTTAGVTLGVYNAGGAGRSDGTLAILPQGIAAANNTAGQDCNDNNAKYGWDDATIAAWAGTSATANLNANTGTQGANTNMWMWIK